MSAQEGLSPNAVGQTPPILIFPPEEVAARAFNIEPVDVEGRQVKLVSVESVIHYTRNRTDFVPADWSDQVADAMRDTSLVFMTYFSPELEKTAYSSRLFGARARYYGELNIHGIYQTIADIAAEQGKPVAVCDIANRPGYMSYERFTPSRVPRYLRNSAYGVNISRSEKYVPQAVDARRMFTARGIAQTIRNYPEGSSFMHVAAPAHINRIRQYLTEPLSRADRMRYRLYTNTIFGMDTSTRIYEHTGRVWELRSNDKYCNPGQEVKPFLAGVAIGAGAVALASRAWRHKNNS